MLQNVGVNTEHRKSLESKHQHRTSSLKLKERNINHTRINNIKDLNDIYTYGELLGRGVFGTVVAITDKTTKKIWALKIVDKRNNKGSNVKIIENEIRILRMVDHPHIVHLERTFESPKHIYMVIEKCNSDLGCILKKKKHFSEAETRSVLDYLANAICYLHKHDIIHRDLKVENILTAPNPNDLTDNLYIKVSDFGLGVVKSCNRPDQMLSDRCGTLTYMAPEIISRASYSQQCDVWAMGVIGYLLISGNFPFISQNETEIVDLICNTEPIFKNKFSPAVVHLLSKMLDKNPALRISAVEICRHPWIRGSTISIANIGNSTHNVLDMMQLWRSEMMVKPTENGSDWAEAFSCLEQTTSELNLGKKSSQILEIIGGRQNTTNALKNGEVVVQKKKDDKKAEVEKIKAEGADGCPNRRSVVTEQREIKTDRALNVKGKNTRLIRIGKIKKNL